MDMNSKARRKSKIAIIRRSGYLNVFDFLPRPRTAKMQSCRDWHFRCGNPKPDLPEICKKAWKQRIGRE
jgi:hypothetical protein